MEQIKTEIVELPISDITPYEGAHNTDGAIESIKESINRFGVYQPITLDRNHVIAKGNAVYRAAKELGLETLPCIIKDDLSDDEIAQYRIADNQTSTFAKWNEQKLKQEVSYLQQPEDLQFAFDEDLQAMLGHNPFEKVSARKEAHGKSEEKKDQEFKDNIKSAEKSMEVKATEYFEYICSQCGKKVMIKI